jgi:hypothetical protein
MPRSQDGQTDRYPGTIQRKAGEMRGENPGAEARAPIFTLFVCLGPPHMPSRRRGTSTRRNAAPGGATTTLRQGLRNATAGLTSDYMRSVFFASLSPPIFGKTEVTRELD